jgi:hypothetical protein
LFLHTFFFESKVFSQVPTLVVAADEEEGLGVVDFAGVEVEEDLDGEGAPVDVVSQEEVVGLCWISSHIKQFD